MTKNKTATAGTVFLFLASMIAAMLVASPIVSGATNYTKKTYAYIGATPNPVGVGEDTLIHLGISDEMQDYKDGYSGLTVTIIRPDNTTETLGPFRTDSTGGTGYIYRPSQVGTYYLQTNFPAQWYNWTMYGGANIWFEASTSWKLTLNVTQEPLPNYPSTPLPTEYWTRPIDSQHYDWHKIAGSWVTYPADLYAPYNEGPETAHILWRKPLMIGGLAGGSTGVMHFNLGGGGQSPWPNSVILSGILLYNRYYSGTERNVVAVDLHTGKELWVRNATLSFGQHFQFVAANQYAGFDYWWETSGSNWTAYDPLTGRIIYQMTDVPSGTSVYGPNGEIFRYVVNLAKGFVAKWNSTAVVSVGWGGGWSPYGRTYNATVSARDTNVWSWNVTIPTGLPGSVRTIYDNDIMLGYYRGGKVLTRVEAGITLDNPPVTAWAINLNASKGPIGQLLWNRTYQMPPGNLTVVFGTTGQKERVWTLWIKELRAHMAFNIDTGEQLWGPTPSQHYMDTFGIPGVCGRIVYDKLYSAGYGGIVYCYDIRTGNLLWTYEAKDPYNEILWSNNWPLKITFITDGKIYFTHGEHSPNSPLPRGSPFFCLNATTGEQIWRIDGAFRGAEWGGNAIIGDSVIAEWNSYDNQVYGISKGPSATTVAASPEVSMEGSSILIKGTVTDVSPGTEEFERTSRFPNGVPAIADQDMSDWMKYVYLQFARPTNAKGVNVVLSVLDANNNYREIGETTSDSDGFFSYQWVPDIPGKYTVVASFEGSKAYYPSRAESAFIVDQAPETPPVEAPTTPADMTDTYVIGIGVAIIIAIAIVGAVIVMMFKKRA